MLCRRCSASRDLWSSTQSARGTTDANADGGDAAGGAAAVDDGDTPAGGDGGGRGPRGGGAAVCPADSSRATCSGTAGVARPGKKGDINSAGGGDCGAGPSDGSAELRGGDVGGGDGGDDGVAGDDVGGGGRCPGWWVRDAGGSRAAPVRADGDCDAAAVSMCDVGDADLRAAGSTLPSRSVRRLASVTQHCARAAGLWSGCSAQCRIS